MRGAAPVSIEPRRAGGWRVGVTLAAAAALAANGIWAATAGAGWAAAALGALVVVCAADLMRVPEGVLRFDGRAWQWRDEPTDVRVAIDLGGWMLLCLAGSRRAWLPVGAASAGDAWRAFRTAVYCPRPFSSPTADAHPSRDV